MEQIGPAGLCCLQSLVESGYGTSWARDLWYGAEDTPVRARPYHQRDDGGAWPVISIITSQWKDGEGQQLGMESVGQREEQAQEIKIKQQQIYSISSQKQKLLGSVLVNGCISEETHCWPQTICSLTPRKFWQLTKPTGCSDGHFGAVLHVALLDLRIRLPISCQFRATIWKISNDSACSIPRLYGGLKNLFYSVIT